MINHTPAQAQYIDDPGMWKDLLTLNDPTVIYLVCLIRQMGKSKKNPGQVLTQEWGVWLSYY